MEKEREPKAGRWLARGKKRTRSNECEPRSGEPRTGVPGILVQEEGVLKR